MSAAHEQRRETGTLHDDCCPCYKKCVVMVLMRWRTPLPWSQHVRPHMRRNWSGTLHTWGSQATVMIFNILRSQKENLRAGVLREASRRRGHLSRTLLVERRGGFLGVCSCRCVHGAGERQNAHPDDVPRMVSYGTSVGRSGAGCWLSRHTSDFSYRLRA